MVGTTHPAFSIDSEETNGRSRMICVAMEMLVLVVVVVLSPSISEGRTLSKCELRDQLNATLPENVLNHIDGLTKLVCHVEMSSGFNTNKMRHISVPELDEDSRERGHGEHQSETTHRSSSEESDEDEDEYEDEDYTSAPIPATSVVNSRATPQGHASLHNRRARSVQSTDEEDDKDKEDEKEEEEEEDDEYDQGSNVGNTNINSATVSPNASAQINASTLGTVVRARRSLEEEKTQHREAYTLYGLFQLPDCIVCSSGTQTSLNLCNMSCNSLLDDDISDDIACVGIILSKMSDKSDEPFEEQVQKHCPTPLQECRGMEGSHSQYFSTC